MWFASISSQVLLFALFSSIAVWSWKKRAQRSSDEQFAVQRGCQPLKPWSAKWPLGLDLLVKVIRYGKAQQILKFFLEVVDQSGTTFEQSLLGARGVDTVDPKNIEAVLSTQFEDFGMGLRAPHFYPLLGSGIFTQDGPAWKHSRELLRPQFTSNRFQNFEVIQDCVDGLLASIPENGLVDLQPLFFRLTFDTTTFILFGKTFSSLKDNLVAGDESEFAKAFNLSQDYLCSRGRLGDLYWLMGGKEFRDACKTCHDFVDASVQKTLKESDEAPKDKSEKKNYVFLDALIEETQDPKVLRDQCLNILLAGRDTTACCLSWAFRLLARHQKVLDRLRSEIKTTIGIGPNTTPPTRIDLKKMTYLNLVIKEVLRLYPSVPVNSRAALKTTTLPVGGGKDGKSPVLLRKGEAVGYAVYAMHRRKDLYGEDAHCFRPERWEGDELKNIGWGYLPFNGGPRVCMGQEFAILEASYTIARILQKYPIVDVPSNEPVVEVGEEKQTLTLVVSSGDGCRVLLKSG